MKMHISKTIISAVITSSLILPFGTFAQTTDTNTTSTTPTTGNSTSTPSTGTDSTDSSTTTTSGTTSTDPGTTIDTSTTTNPGTTTSTNTGTTTSTSPGTTTTSTTSTTGTTTSTPAQPIILGGRIIAVNGTVVTLVNDIRNENGDVIKWYRNHVGNWEFQSNQNEMVFTTDVRDILLFGGRRAGGLLEPKDLEVGDQIVVKGSINGTTITPTFFQDLDTRGSLKRNNQSTNPNTTSTNPNSIPTNNWSDHWDKTTSTSHKNQSNTEE